MPVSIPSFSSTAASASVGVLPAPAPMRRVDASTCCGARLDRRQRVGDATGEVLVAVEADLDVADGAAHGSDPHGRLGRDERAGRVDHVDAQRARVGHDPRLLGQDRRRAGSATSSGSRRSRGRARGRPADAGRRRRPPCSGWRCARSRRRGPRPPGDRRPCRSRAAAAPRSVRARAVATAAEISSRLGRAREAVGERASAEPVAVGDLEHGHAGARRARRRRRGPARP